MIPPLESESGPFIGRKTPRQEQTPLADSILVLLDILGLDISRENMGVFTTAKDRIHVISRGITLPAATVQSVMGEDFTHPVSSVPAMKFLQRQLATESKFLGIRPDGVRGIPILRCVGHELSFKAEIDRLVSASGEAVEDLKAVPFSRLRNGVVFSGAIAGLMTSPEDVELRPWGEKDAHIYVNPEAGPTAALLKKTLADLCQTIVVARKGEIYSSILSPANPREVFDRCAQSVHARDMSSTAQPESWGEWLVRRFPWPSGGHDPESGPRR